MLASGAHVKIGNYEFELAEDVDAGSSVGSLYRPHYRWSAQPMFNQKIAIAGTQSKDNLRPERLITYFDDFIGGEGNRSWDPQDPPVTYYGNATNPRIGGQLTGRPSRTLDTSSLVATKTVSAKPRFALAAGTLWEVGGYSINYVATAPSTWANVGNSATTASDFVGLQNLSTSYAITSATGDSKYLYYSAFRSGPLRTLMAQVVSTNTTFVSLTTAVETTGSAYAGMALMNGALWCWTGVSLSYYNVASWDGASALTENFIYGTTASVPTSLTLGTDYWADAVAAENSVFCFFSSAGQSVVYRAVLTSAQGTTPTYAFAPVWNAQAGFTIKSIAYMNGIVYVTGHWVNGFGGIFAIPQDTIKPIFVGYVRKQVGSNLQCDVVRPSYGAQVMVADGNSGRMFVYDADEDGLSNFDTVATTGGDSATILPTDALSFTSTNYIGDLITWQNKRYAIVYQPDGGDTSTAYSYIYYGDDEPGNRQAGTATNTAVSVTEWGNFDNDLPFQQKTLMGYDLTWQGTIASGQSIKVEYSMDGAAYATASTITSASSDAAKGRTFIDLSAATDTLYTRFQTRVTLSGTSGVQPPILNSFAAESILLQNEYTWELLIRLKNANRNSRPNKNSVSASVLRTYLRSLVTTGTTVTFLDGYRSNLPGVYSTVTVTVEDMEDTILRDGEGTAHITLRQVLA